jgi:hypothetical protein
MRVQLDFIAFGNSSIFFKRVPEVKDAEINK